MNLRKRKIKYLVERIVNDWLRKNMELIQAVMQEFELNLDDEADASLVQ